MLTFVLARVRMLSSQLSSVFIKPSFSTGSGTGGDDSCPFTTFSKNCYQQSLCQRITNYELSLFVLPAGITCLIKRIKEYLSGFFKAYTMFVKVDKCLMAVPLKLSLADEKQLSFNTPPHLCM